MALVTHPRRASPSEFTLNYYDTKRRLGGKPLLLQKEEETLPIAVPPLLPRDVGGAWSAPPLINPSVWRDSHQTKLHEAKSATSFSERLREENKRLCDETRNLTNYHQANVDRRLKDRCCDVEFWQNELNHRHVQLSEDLEGLMSVKDRTEKQFQKFLYPLEVAEKCVQIRKERSGIELVEDETSAALQQEIQDLHYCRSVLSRTFKDCKGQVRKVRSCLYHLKNNVNDKRSALKVDTSTAQLTPLESSTDIIPDQQIDPSPLMVHEWRRMNIDLAKRSEDEHKLSVQLMSLAEALLASSARQVRETIGHTNGALTRRIDDTRNAKAKVEEEHAKIVNEESELNASMADLQKELEAKRRPLAIAQTRLQIRLRRPKGEKTRDEVEAALIKEIEELETTINRLLTALSRSEHQLQGITSSKHSLELDINLKTKTLLVDEVQVQGLRSTLKIDKS